MKRTLGRLLIVLFVGIPALITAIACFLILVFAVLQLV